MSYAVAKDTAVIITIGPLLDFSDGATPVTAPTLGDITATIIKGGGTSAGPARSAITLTASGGSNDFVHLGEGYFSLELAAGNTDTVGTMRVTLTDPDVILPVWEDVIVYSPYGST